MTQFFFYISYSTVWTVNDGLSGNLSETFENPPRVSGGFWVGFLIFYEHFLKVSSVNKISGKPYETRLGEFLDNPSLTGHMMPTY